MRCPLVRRLVVTLAGGFALLAATSSVPAGSAPDPGSGSIIVRAAGDRDAGSGAPVALTGATLVAFADASLTVPAGGCTTDATGSCTIPDLVAGTYHVAPTGDPVDSPFSHFETVTTSMSGRQRYAETVVVDEGNPTTRRFAYRRANPAFPARCGVRTTLVYDLSGSISAGEALTMQKASLEFVDALARTPSSIAIASFATSAPAAGNTNLGPTSVLDDAGVAAVKAAVRALTRPEGDDRFTNWDAAFRSVTGQSDVVVLFTDGNPTVHGLPAQHPPVVTGLDQLDAGVASANAVKAAGARVLAVGVGDLDALAKENLALVSGPVEGSDFAVSTFADVRSVFRRLADELCPGPEAPPPPSPVPDGPVPRFTG